MTQSPVQQAQSPVQQVMQVACGFIGSAALYVATTLGIADHLASGPQTTAQLALATGTNEDALYRVLRLLGSLGIFAETAPRCFGLTPSAQVLRSDVPGSARGVTRFLPDPFHFRIYANLIAAVRTGTPASHTTLGMPVFEYLASNPDYSQIFNEAMTGFSAEDVPAVLAAYDFGGAARIVDVAGGHGELLLSILAKHPEAHGVLTDVSHVVEGARPRIAAAGLADRCSAVAVDFFASVPEGGDIYLLKHIIHDWDDAAALAILRNVRRAMTSPVATVIVLDAVIAPGAEPDFAKFLDIEMLALPGGRERSEPEFRALLAGAGLRLTRVVPTTAPMSVLEAHAA